MKKLNSIIILSWLLALKTAGQVKIIQPTNIPIAGQFDSLRLVASKFSIGDTIINSKVNFDLRIYRFMAFGDYKVIRISTLSRHRLAINIYSLTQRKDSLIYHKSFSSIGIDLKVKELVKKYDILNIPNLNYDFIVANSLPRANDGNIYSVEAKVGNDFTYKEYDNPEIYSLHFSDKAKQAKVFTDFIKDLERLLDIKISEPEILRGTCR
jgi:hypothetical protein